MKKKQKTKKTKNRGGANENDPRDNPRAMGLERVSSTINEKLANQLKEINNLNNTPNDTQNDNNLLLGTGIAAIVSLVLFKFTL